MTSYCSLAYLGLFLPATVLVYGVLPLRHRSKVLLAASYLFFWSVSGKLVIFLLASTFSLHHFGLWLDDVRLEGERRLTQTESGSRRALRAQVQAKSRRILAFALVLHLGVLLALKYTAFFSGNLNHLLGVFGLPALLPVPSFLLPIGISFYTLQAAGYLIDVYRGKFPAERNFGRLALFLAFFPQLMEGPICQYDQTARSLWEGRALKWQNVTFGAQRILFGVMKKVVIADRLNLLIQSVFADYATLDGGLIALGAVCYTCQLYMEFSGAMDIVIGSAEMFGLRLPENFRQPFFSQSISEFWTRWHISLGAWFKSYVFYPLSLSGPIKKLGNRVRKRFGPQFGPLLSGSVALLAVWLCNGLWHGAGWKYIFFGLYHFALILGGSLVAPLSRGAADRLRLPYDAQPLRLIRIVRTGALVCIGELFFRADGLRAGLAMFHRMIFDSSLAWNGAFWELGLDKHDVFILCVAVLLVLAVDLGREKGIPLRQSLADRPLLLRWVVYDAAVLFIVVFGAYGPGYVPVDPIYAAF